MNLMATQRQGPLLPLSADKKEGLRRGRRLARGYTGTGRELQFKLRPADSKAFALSSAPSSDFSGEGRRRGKILGAALVEELSLLPLDHSHRGMKCSDNLKAQSLFFQFNYVCQQQISPLQAEGEPPISGTFVTSM